MSNNEKIDKGIAKEYPKKKEISVKGLKTTKDG